MVPADSARISRVPAYSGAALSAGLISLTGLSPAAAGLSRPFCYLTFHNVFGGPTTPDDASLHLRFGLLRVRSPLLAQSWLLSFPPGNEMFQFPGFAHCFRSVPPSLAVGCPIRTSAHLRVFASPRGFSQLITSFVASKSLGILHVPFSPFSFSFA